MMNKSNGGGGLNENEVEYVHLMHFLHVHTPSLSFMRDPYEVGTWTLAFPTRVKGEGASGIRFSFIRHLFQPRTHELKKNIFSFLKSPHFWNNKPPWTSKFSVRSVIPMAFENSPWPATLLMPTVEVSAQLCVDSRSHSIPSCICLLWYYPANFHCPTILCRYLQG